MQLPRGPKAFSFRPKKVSLIIVCQRSFPTERILQRRGRYVTVRRRFPREPGLTLLFVMRDVSPQIKPTSESGHEVQTVVQWIAAVLQPAGRTSSKMLAEFIIGRQQRSGHQAKRHRPLPHIVELYPKRTGPNNELVLLQMFSIEWIPNQFSLRSGFNPWPAADNDPAVSHQYLPRR